MTSTDADVTHRALDAAIADVRSGRFVVLVDGHDAAGEGDLVIAAGFASPETINFMAIHACGLIRLALTAGRCDELRLAPMAPSAPQADFTVSIEAREGVTTGVSAADRARTIAVASASDSGPDDLVIPGHVFPLRAQAGGVLDRPGRAEAATDLARLAGLRPAGVVCQILDEDGRVATGAKLAAFCATHGFRVVAVEDLVGYRRRVERIADADPGALSHRERELIRVAVLVALGAEEARLATHMRAALRHGASEGELLEAVEAIRSPAGAPRFTAGLRAFERARGEPA